MKYSQNNEQEIVEAFFNGFVGRCFSVGENDGQTLSNVKSLIDKGWDAVLIEPSETAFNKLIELHKDNPKVLCYKLALSNFNGEADFFESSEHLGIGDTSLLSSLSFEETKRWSKESFTKNKTQVSTFKDFMIDKLFQTFDLISIDAEGVDFLILEQINLYKTKTAMVIVEWNSKNFNKFDNYFKQYSFKLHDKNHENLIYVSALDRRKFNS
mgnify:CR=1 FL=1